MPFVSVSTYHKEHPVSQQNTNTDERNVPATTGQSSKDARGTMQDHDHQKLLRAYKDHVMHSSPTLDEYYYQFGTDGLSQKDRDLRNEEQVVTRSLLKEGEKKGDSWRLLRVNQLWVWTFGDGKS